MKRIKHITINLNEEQYKALLYIAEKQRRKTSDAAYILLIDSIDDVLRQLTVIKSGRFEKLTFN